LRTASRGVKSCARIQGLAAIQGIPMVQSRNARIFGSVFLAAATLLLAAGLVFRSDGVAQTRPGGQIRAIASGPVHLIGILALRGSQDSKGAAGLVELPDIAVELRAPTGGAALSADTTLLDGKFDLTAPKAGTYLLCTTIAKKTSCDNRLVAGNRDRSVGNVVIRPERTIVYGTVLTRDGRPCWMRDHFFGIDFVTDVKAQNAGGDVGSPVHANVQGEYALFDLPAGGPYDVIATCEKAKVAGAAMAGNMIRRDLVLPNHAPRLDAVGAKTTAGRPTLRAEAGDKVQVAAQAIDRDGDKIQYLWRTPDGNGDVGNSSAPSQVWKLPGEDGLHSVYLLARDGKGGYAYRRFDMPSASKVRFSGTVIDEATGAPIKGATASIGADTATTNDRGWFSLDVRPNDRDRYILNVRADNYAEASRIYRDSSTGESYDLIRAKVTRVPAGGKLVFADDGAGKCGVPADGRKRPVRALATPQLITVPGARPSNPKTAQGLQALLRAPGAQAPCDRRGARIAADPGAFVDARTGKTVGAVTGSVATFDPSRRALPGDYGAIGADRAQARLFSYGAVFAEFRGPGGEKLKLADGQSAELRIPIPASQRASAQPVIALWSYDDEKGIWVEEGDAQLQNGPDGPYYVGRTKHFSTINMDIKIDGGTCARFHVPPGTFSGWSELKLRAYVTFGGTNSQTFETPLNGDQMHAVFRIPFGPATAPNTLRFEVTGKFGGVTSILLNNIVDIDTFAIAGSDAYSYPADYEECGVPIELAAPAGVIPAYGKDASGRPYFLTGPSGGFNPAPADYDPATYYLQIDPGTAKGNLGAWWGLNGFDATTGQAGTGTGFTEAHYLNNNDLGFGRDMHCIKNAGDKLACYVTNYGLPDQDPTNADLPIAKRGATVTMEFDPGAIAGQGVQFYVYGGGVAGSPRIKYADLDGFGPKPVPQLCTVCHGGRYQAVPKLAVGSAFREFDLPSFKYPGGHDWNYGDPVDFGHPSQAEFHNFAALNQMVHDIAPTTKIGNLITAWYPGGFGLADLRPGEPAPPAGWPGATNAALYHGPYGKGCRACHIARSLDFDAASFGGTSYRVCGLGRVMPNAVVTYKNFWADSLDIIKYEDAAGFARPPFCKDD
jgi:hypothetical protein